MAGLRTSNTDIESPPDTTERLESFVETLCSYDDKTVQAVVDTLTDSDSLESPALSTDEWLTVLETAGEDLYLRAKSDGEDVTHWYLRHDGDAFVYATSKTGELYRGTRYENAYRQARSVIDNHDVYPHPMETYPLKQLGTDQYIVVPSDR